MRCWRAQKVDFHDWETATPYFDGCLPIEVMAERGRETLRHGPMKPFGLTNPKAPHAEALCGRPAAPGQPAGHPVQHGGIPDQAHPWGAGAHFPHHPGPRGRRVRPARRPAPQHLPQRPQAPRPHAPAQGRSAPALRRPDHRLRGLCGIGRDRAHGGPLRGRFAARQTVGAAAADDRPRGAAGPHHRRPYRDHRCGAALLSAHEHQFRACSRRSRSLRPGPRTAPGCAEPPRRWPRRAPSAAARSAISRCGSPMAITPWRPNNNPVCRSCRKIAQCRCRAKSKDAGAPAWCSSATCSRAWSAAASAPTTGEVEAVLRRIDEVPWWSFPARPPSVRPRAGGARRRRRARRGAAALLCRAPRAGARLDRRRGVASRQAPRRPRLFPLRQGGLAQAAPRRHLPQRSRQGAELAARQRWPRLRHRFSARHAVQAPQPAVSHRRLRGPAASVEAQAALCARGDQRRGAARARAQERLHPPVDGDRQARLPMGDARHLALHRPRGRRPAPGLRRAAHQRAPHVASAGARGRHRGLSGSARRHRPLCLRRGRSRPVGARAARFHGGRRRPPSRPSTCRSPKSCRAGRAARFAAKSSSSSP